MPLPGNGVADADVLVDDVFDQASVGSIRRDADAVIRAIQGQVIDTDATDAAGGFAADGEAVAPVEMVVGDGDVGSGSVAGRDGDVVVAGTDEGLSDGDVLGLRGIDAVGVARGPGGVDLNAPHGEAVAVLEQDVGAG